MASNAEVDGAVFLCAAYGSGDANLPFVARGPVSLTGIKVGGNLEMGGGSVQRLSAANARIGGSVFFRAWEGAKTATPFIAAGEVSLLGASIQADLDISGAVFHKTFNASNSDIGGNVWLNAWQDLPLTADIMLDMSGSRIRNRLYASGIRTEAGKVTIDLSHATTEVLDDENGMAWGTGVVMKLQGFRYEQLAGLQTADPRKFSRAAFLRHPALLKSYSASRDRIEWLNLEYPFAERRPNIRDYSPEAYDMLTRAFRVAGHYADARAITRERLRVERKISGFAFARPFQELYAFLFDSGLSPARAAVTFLSFIAIGWCATAVADHGWARFGIRPALVLETSTVNSLVVASAGAATSFTPGLLIGRTGSTAIAELPCGSRSSRCSTRSTSSSPRSKSTRRAAAASRLANSVSTGGSRGRPTP